LCPWLERCHVIDADEVGQFEEHHIGESGDHDGESSFDLLARQDFAHVVVELGPAGEVVDADRLAGFEQLRRIRV
jgi:hypothetical protein